MIFRRNYNLIFLGLFTRQELNDKAVV